MSGVCFFLNFFFSQVFNATHNKLEMATGTKEIREIRVAVRGGDVFRCDPTWTVNEAQGRIRATCGLSGGGIKDQDGMMDDDDLIGNAVGDLTFMWGRDLPVQAMTQPQPTGKLLLCM